MGGVVSAYCRMHSFRALHRVHVARLEGPCRNMYEETSGEIVSFVLAGADSHAAPWLERSAACQSGNSLQFAHPCMQTIHPHLFYRVEDRGDGMDCS